MLTTGCYSNKKASDLKFDSNRDNVSGNENLQQELLLKKLKAEVEFLKAKESTWNTLVEDAKSEFEVVWPVLKRKCASCHDSDKPLPFYGKPFGDSNSIRRHRDDGLDAMDFSTKFPIKAKGNPPQVAILKAIRQSVTERTMPLKIYTFFYPFRKINKEDEELLLNWLDPLILRLEDFDRKYNAPANNDINSNFTALMEQRCFRCHANGNARGGFENLDDFKALVASKWVNREQPEESLFYKIVQSGEMPPDPKQRFNPEELKLVSDWIEFQTKN